MPQELDATIQAVLQQAFDEPLAALRRELGAGLSRAFAAAQEIREGRKIRNLYGLLKEEIDKSREAYLRKFAQLVPSTDYFHLELLRTLAGDQEDLLGPDYPGPLTEAIFT